MNQDLAVSKTGRKHKDEQRTKRDYLKIKENRKRNSIIEASGRKRIYFPRVPLTIC